MSDNKRKASQNENLDDKSQVKKAKLSGVDLICSMIDFEANDCYTEIPKLSDEIRTFAEEYDKMSYSYSRFFEDYCSPKDGIFPANQQTFIQFMDVFRQAIKPECLNLTLAWFNDEELKVIKEVMLILNGSGDESKLDKRGKKLLELVKTPPPRVTPVYQSMGSSRTGSLPSKLHEREITKRLGVKPIYGSGDGKVDTRWEFRINGMECAIWDYKGSKWSTYDPHNVLHLVFPEAINE